MDLLGCSITEGTIKPDSERILFDVRWECSLSITNGLPSILKKRPHPNTSHSSLLAKTAEKTFEYLKAEIKNVIVYSLDETVLFIVETDASYHSIMASLNQSGRAVAFFSRTLSTCELKYSSIEKEVQAVVEAFRKWRHFLTKRHFTQLIDKRSVAFMFDSKQAEKILKMIKSRGGRLNLPVIVLVLNIARGKIMLLWIRYLELIVL